jgi:hypothetical protein
MAAMWAPIIIILAVIVMIVMVIIIVGSTVYKYRTYYLAEKVFKKRRDINIEVVNEQDLSNLPDSVRNYLTFTQVIGKQKIRTCRLKQKGYIRTYPERGWMSLRAEEYFSVDPPAFLWNAKMRVALLPLLFARDSYIEGKGNVLLSFLSFITTANAHGKELDQSALLRYLGEMVWSPTAFLGNNIEWEDIESGSVRATLTYKDATATAVFHFDEENKITGLTALRYRNANGRYSLDKWSMLVKDYKERNGIRIPIRSEMIWELESGDFSYFKGKLTHIDYNWHHPY